MPSIPCPHCEVPIMLTVSKDPRPSLVSAVGTAAVSVGGDDLLFMPAHQDSLVYQFVGESPGRSTHPVNTPSLYHQQYVSGCSGQGYLGALPADYRIPKSSERVYDTRIRRTHRHGRRTGGSALPADSDTLPGRKEGSSGLLEIEGHPLYCDLCRVKLNAQIQAEQHYTGKQHRRRVKMRLRVTSNTDENMHERTTSVKCQVSNV